MKQLSLLEYEPKAKKWEFFFRLDFWVYSRWSHSFTLKKIPDIENQKLMIQIFFNDPEVKELMDKYWLTGFELCKDDE